VQRKLGLKDKDLLFSMGFIKRWIQDEAFGLRPDEIVQALKNDFKVE
jgi:hypothetical protein